MTRKNLRRSAVSYAVVLGLIVTGLLARQGNAQIASAAETVSPLIQQAQTLHLPIHAYSLPDASPITDLRASDLHLNVDGKPTDVQFSHPLGSTSNSSSETPPNVLMIVPLASPLDRNDAIHEAILALKLEPQLDWNISILDDGGKQTPYTRKMPTVIAELEKIGAENRGVVNLADWRSTASLAIATMRDLPGRRVVLTLGDIFHVMVYQDGDLVYEALNTRDVAVAARNSGVVIYAAESAADIPRLKKISPQYSVLGSGPWMLISEDDQLAGWISGSVSETLQEIRRDDAAFYNLDLNLDRKQMDGLPHGVSITLQRPNIFLSAPAYYVAPSLPQLQELSKASAALLKTLETPPSDVATPLQLATQVEYFPHPDGKIGTQIIGTGFFWTKATPPPSPLQMALQLEQTNVGFTVGTLVDQIAWSSSEPVRNTAIDVMAGAYRLRVAAADATGKIMAGTAANFTVAPTDPDEKVRISSLVLGNACVFSPESLEVSAQPPTQPSAPSQTIDYLRAGNCTLQLDPGNAYSPQDILWTLVRITPVGKLAERPSKDWKGSFQLVDANGSRLAEEPVQWLTAEDGSLVGTTAFPLGNPKLKLSDGEYAVVLKLSGPGLEHDYEEDAPFLIYGTAGK